MSLRVLPSLALLATLCACNPETTVERGSLNKALHEIGSEIANKSNWPVAGVIASTPPYNTLLFGPCTPEFGMPDSRRATCDLYYDIRGKTSPWETVRREAIARENPMNELQCIRTLGGVPECWTVSGTVRQPLLNAPGMGAN